MRITVPAGQKCVYTYSHESELIFPHGVTLDVMAERQQGTVTMYEMTML
jgi:hypothetical protein